jgi:sodium/potassium-transporting ATPase subunit alpha
LTAAAIATDIGIFTNKEVDTLEKVQIKVKLEEAPTNTTTPGEKKCSSLLLNGSDLNKITFEEWRLITKYDEVVFARISPEQKLLIVNEFQHDGHVVGVTGDGVNDAPALKTADIGIAMGSGSEVAMEASQLVLLDNNFSSMLIAIENGRLVFENLRKVILYLLPAGSIGNYTKKMRSIL